MTIQEALGLSDSEYLKILEITPKEFNKIKNSQSKFTTVAIGNLCDALELDIDRVFSGDIDYEAMCKHRHGENLTLPEKYSVPSQSLATARSILSKFSFLDRYYDPGYSRRLMRKFQIRPQIFNHPDLRVSPVIGIDIMKQLVRDGFDEHDLRLMGNHTIDVYRKTKLGRELSRFKTAKEIYRAMHEELMHYFDGLWDYQLTKLTDKGCTVAVTTKQRISDVFSDHTVGSREICLFRQGTYMTILSNIYPDVARLLESECMYSGGKRCIYHIYW